MIRAVLKLSGGRYLVLGRGLDHALARVAFGADTSEGLGTLVLSHVVSSMGFSPGFGHDVE